MRSIIYNRVSEDRAHGRSVEEQEAENRRVVERNGWELAQVFTDNSLGASRYSKGVRTEWLKLVDLLKQGDIEVMVTWEASRSTRDLEAYLELRTVCRKFGILWCYNGRLHDFSSSSDSFQTGLDILLAEKEVEQTRERVMRAMRSNAAKGRPHGKLLYGYKREYHNGIFVRQVIDEDQAAIIRAAATRFLGGETPYRIAQDFNERGIPAARGGDWNLTQIRRLLTNPAYISQRKHQGKIVGTGDWPAILDEATFQRCVAKFDDPSRKMNRDSAVKHLLTGIARCGVCGNILKYGKPRGYASYICVTKFCVARKQAPVDALVTELVLRRLEQPDALALFVQDDDDHVLDDVAHLRARLEGFYDAAAIGEITPAALGRIEASMLEQIARLERQVRRVSAPTVVYDLLESAREVWPSLAITQQREVVRCLLDVEILRTRSGKRAFDPESVRVTWRGQPSAELVAPG